MISVVDATPDRWPSVEQVMGTRGDPSRCWCQFFRLPGAGWSRATAPAMREALHEQVVGRTPPGVLAFSGDEAVGWCAAGPRWSYPRLGRARAVTAASLYHGPLQVFLRAGFTEVARPVPGRAVVRLEVGH
jgi:hypothetical protein